MKKLPITKEAFEKSKYFTKKYGKLEYVSESGKLFKTNKGKVLKFNESEGSFFGIPGVVERHDMIIYKNCHIEPSEFWGNLGELYDEEHPEDTNHEGFDNWCWENSDLIESELEHLASYDDNYEGDDYYAESRKKFGKKFKESLFLPGYKEGGVLAKVNDLVSKAYASLYDELKKAGIDFDSSSDDGFYVNDPDAQKTYFINLYVNECQEYEGSYK
jgi:hypothetical protein